MLIYTSNGQEHQITHTEIESLICRDCCMSRRDLKLQELYSLIEKYSLKDGEYICIGEIFANLEEKINKGKQIDKEDRKRIKEIIEQCHSCRIFAENK